MTTTDSTGSTATAFGIAGGLAAVWAVAALVRPSATFHLAPILVVLTPLLATARDRRIPARLTAGTVLIALATSLLLAAVDLMRGPSLLPFGGALTEAVVFAAAGAGAVMAAGRFDPRREA